ncbi:MAG: flagellar motor protein MotB [Pseudomonadota bacterium]|jgi:flagellar motor protein MotB
MTLPQEKPKKLELDEDTFDHLHNRVQFDEHDEEPWLVSYADMMTLLFGFFVLMYSFAAAKEGSKSLESIKKVIAEQFGGKFVTSEVEDQSKNPPIVTASSFTSDWEIGTKKDESEKDGKKETYRTRGIREFQWNKSTPIKELEILMPVSRLFINSGSSVSESGSKFLQQMAADFQQRNKDDKMIIEVHGYSSSETPDKILRLTTLQAAEIMSALVKAGVAARDITAGGYGNLLIDSGELNAASAKKSSTKKNERVVRFRIQEFVKRTESKKE